MKILEIYCQFAGVLVLTLIVISLIYVVIEEIKERKKNG